MGVCRGDSSHEPNSPFHVIPQVPWIHQILAVIFVGVKRGVDNLHNYNSILEASWKGLSEEVVKQMACFEGGLQHFVQAVMTKVVEKNKAFACSV